MENNLPLEWKLSMPMADMGFAFTNYINTAVQQQMPELVDLFPLRNGWHSESHKGEGWIAFRIVDRLGTGSPAGGEMNSNDVAELRSRMLPFRNFTHQDLYKILGDSWFGFDRFSYVGPYSEPFACWPDAVQHLVDWLNLFVVPEVLRRNKARTARAIPDLSQVDRARLLQSLWVLECEESMTQGSAFYVHNVGLITCDHVLGSTTHAFQPQNLRDRHPIQIVIRNSVIDLAILKIDITPTEGLDIGSADNAEQLDRIVAAGFPNY